MEAVTTWRSGGTAVSVRWPDGSSDMYRFGAEDCFDVVVAKERDTRRIARLRQPVSAALSARSGEGVVQQGVLIRLAVTSLAGMRSRQSDVVVAGAGAGAGTSTRRAVSEFEVCVAGTVEWPLYSAVVAVDGTWKSFRSDDPNHRDGGVITLTEREFVSGVCSNGWASRFGHNHWYGLVCLCAPLCRSWCGFPFHSRRHPFAVLYSFWRCVCILAGHRAPVWCSRPWTVAALTSEPARYGGPPTSLAPLRSPSRSRPPPSRHRPCRQRRPRRLRHPVLVLREAMLRRRPCELRLL